MMKGSLRQWSSGLQGDIDAGVELFGASYHAAVTSMTTQTFSIGVPYGVKSLLLCIISKIKNKLFT